MTDTPATLLTRGEACALLGCSAWHLTYLAKRGSIRRERVGGGLLRDRFGYHAGDVRRLAAKLDRFGKLTCERAPGSPRGAR